MHGAKRLKEKRRKKEERILILRTS